ncbi:MAG TPA: hypothetical protein VHB21_13610, partial [Minicystis sp.]|nr:hypothetical protein [Minicystis sp.]
AQQQASARYKAALSPVLEVAEADRLLAAAELDDAVARLEVWHALFAAAYAAGDVDRFLAGLGPARAGG